jgi:hypothetical protein
LSFSSGYAHITSSGVFQDVKSYTAHNVALFSFLLIVHNLDISFVLIISETFAHVVFQAIHCIHQNQAMFHTLDVSIFCFTGHFLIYHSFGQDTVLIIGSAIIIFYV